MTQAELAGSDFSKGFISLIESGRTRISLRAAGILASRLEVSLAVLLGESPAGDLGLESALMAALRRAEQLERVAERAQVEVRLALSRLRGAPARPPKQRRVSQHRS